MVALAHPNRKISVRVVSTESLLAERDALLQDVGYSKSEELFEHIEHGSYSEKERIAAERLEAIGWLLDQDA